MTGILSDIIEDLLKSINNNEESELDYLTTLSSSSPPSRTTQNSNMRTYYPLEYGNMNVSSLSQEKMVVTSSLIQFSPPVALISVNIRA
jgi:positive regulator of sigma E activity